MAMGPPESPQTWAGFTAMPRLPVHIKETIARLFVTTSVSYTLSLDVERDLGHVLKSEWSTQNCLRHEPNM